jgi:hypothetical protein
MLSTLHAFMGHLDFFWELPVQFICPLTRWVVHSLQGLFFRFVYSGYYADEGEGKRKWVKRNCYDLLVSM